MKKLQFKGKEFKGSEGEFYVADYAGYLEMSTDPFYGEDSLLQVDHVGEETAQANGRLFANSKKLLEAAIKLSEFIEERKDVGTPDYWSDMYDFHRNLEQAILDSL